MLEGLFAAAAGMSAQQEQLDAVANNLANVSTDGYHAEEVAFSDLLYSTVDEAGTLTTAGAGSTAHTAGYSAAQGALRETGQPLDLAIAGEGFFALKRADGRVVLSRDGAFTLDGKRQIVNGQGSLLDPPITLPAGVSPDQVTVAADGTVRAGAKTIGRIAIVNVAAPQKLLAAGESDFTVTPASGPAKPARGATVIQGSLEGSDVEVGSEMASMMTAERSYQMGASAVQMEGQMMSIADQIYTSS